MSLQHNHIIFLPMPGNSTLHKVSLPCCWLLSRHIRSTQQFQNLEGLLQLSVVTLMTRYDTLYALMNTEDMVTLVLKCYV